MDLIGNVIEWTSSVPWAYPGSPFEVKEKEAKGKLMVRGGSAEYKSTGEQAITSTFRLETPITTRAAVLGFRLVRDE
jgi:formylglycine-generating enzyme required for sulfatase activity